MNDVRCAMESEVLAAVRSGVWSEELQLHAAGCELCAETAFVSAHLVSEAVAWNAAVLPDPGLLWRRALLEEHDARFKRATRVIALMQGVAFVIGAALALYGSCLLGPALRDGLASLAGGVDGASLAHAAARPGLVVVASFLTLVALFLHDRWQDV